MPTLKATIKCGTPAKALSLDGAIASVVSLRTFATQTVPSKSLTITKLDHRANGASVVLTLQVEAMGSVEPVEIHLKSQALGIDLFKRITPQSPASFDIGGASLARTFVLKGVVPGAKGGVTINGTHTFTPALMATYGISKQTFKASAVTDDKGGFTFTHQFLSHGKDLDQTPITLTVGGSQVTYFVRPTGTGGTVEIVLGPEPSAKGASIKSSGKDSAVGTATEKPRGTTTFELSAPAPTIQVKDAASFIAAEEAILKKLPIVRGFYSKAEANISMRSQYGRVDLDPKSGRLAISDFRWSVSQRQTPIYGFASVLYDHLAYGTTIVTGNFVLNIGDYNALNRAIANSNPFGHHYGEDFDITIYVGDDQFHRGISDWYIQSIQLLGARLEEAGNSKELSGEPDVMMYSFVARNVIFGVADRKSDVYSKGLAPRPAAVPKTAATQGVAPPVGTAPTIVSQAIKVGNLNMFAAGKPVYLYYAKSGGPPERVDVSTTATVNLSLVEGQAYKMWIEIEGAPPGPQQDLVPAPGVIDCNFLQQE